MQRARSTTQRRASSPATANRWARLTLELKPSIEKLTGADEDRAKETGVDPLAWVSEGLQTLRHACIDGEHVKDVKDVFRSQGGFQAIASLMVHLSSSYSDEHTPKENRPRLLVTVRETIGLLVATLKDHAGNRRYFEKKVGIGGWISFQKSISVVVQGMINHDEDSHNVELLFGTLLAAAVGEEVFEDIYTRATKAFNGKRSLDTLKNGPASMALHGDEQSLKYEIEKRISSTPGIRTADFLRILAQVWFTLSRSNQMALSKSGSLLLSIPYAFLALARLSKQDLRRLLDMGISSKVLPYLFDRQTSDLELAINQELATFLFAGGVTCLEDAAYLYQAAHKNPQAAKFLLSALKSSKYPPSIHFDLTQHGYSSVEVPTLGRHFPPTHTPGYTFAIWARFEQFDPNAHTTIFGAFDHSQSCFVLAYLEKDTRNFIFQTSISGSRPSVRFKSISFQAGQWYHICIVHRRHPGGSSKASLYVNGEFTEQTKSHYPASPKSVAGKHDPRVQAFLGTPQDLAATVGRGVSKSKWEMASAVLFEDAFSDDLISVFYHLSPRYNGNYQDCLGSFQTYAASAALNLRNETFHPGKEEQSDIVSAIRNKASLLIPEACVILNISPTAILDDNDENNIDESQLVKALSKEAAHNLHQFIRSGGNAVAINGSVPSINDALTQDQGVAVLTGDPVVTVPHSLDDASWRLGGCTSIDMSLVEAANTDEQLLLAVEILFETVQDNWRNSEAMERDNGYGILAMLIRDKLALNSPAGPKLSAALGISRPERNVLALQLLRLILTFVGYDFQTPNKSIINNPLAYRVLLVDLDIWHFGDLAIQDLYYSQYVTFGVESLHHRFNSKRLTRMRAVKKLLDALKAEEFTSSNFPLFMQAFEPLLLRSLSAELLRSLALFITYAISRDRTARKNSRFDIRPRKSTPTQSSDTENILSKKAIGVELLGMYADMLCRIDDVSIVRKFARTVTNKWLLYLMSENEADVVVLATKILARLLVLHGHSYIKKFADKSGGFIIMRHRLKRWWHLPTLWPLCFAILFGQDVAKLDLERPFDLFGFLDAFAPDGEVKVVNPEVFGVIVAMLQAGVKVVVRDGKGVQSRPSTANPDHTPTKSKGKAPDTMSLVANSESTQAENLTEQQRQNESIIGIIIHFLSDVHSRSARFRDFTTTSSYTQDILRILFPVVVGSDLVSAETELSSKKSGLTFDGSDVTIQPLTKAPPVLQTSSVDTPQAPLTGQRLRRNSSFILVTSNSAKHSPSPARLRHVAVPSTHGQIAVSASHSSVQGLLELVVSVFSDQLLTRKDFPGLGLFLKTPPGFLEHQVYFESWLLRNTLSQIGSSLMLNQKLLWEPRVLTNLARLVTQIGEAIFEGYFLGGAEATLDFAGHVLEYLQRDDVASLKSVRLCHQAVSTIRSVLFRIVLLKLSEVDDEHAPAFLDRLTYWQTVLLSSQETQAEYLRLMCYLLYARLISENNLVRLSAANLWRIILVQKPDETSEVLNYSSSSEHKRLSSGFQKLVELDNETFIYWVDDRRDDLDSFFFGALSKAWESFVKEENATTEDSARTRLSRRREKLRLWSQEDVSTEDVIRRHEVTFSHWTSNIFSSETLKYQRSLQDQQDNATFLAAAMTNMLRDLRRQNGLLATPIEQKWRLDQTEGRNRMRLRVTPDNDKPQQEYRPKRKSTVSRNMSGHRIEAADLKLNTSVKPVNDPISVTPSNLTAEPEASTTNPQEDSDEEKAGLEESFEIVEDPKEGMAEYEDKNRKVMRSLYRGEQVQQVANVSRIVGLEACEGLMILGKDHLYMLDNFFQRADGEIVNVWQAPPEERDSYVRMISGRESNTTKVSADREKHETRSWRWDDVISVSKRRFLFRDVAIEIFFTDGRSYLLTLINISTRDDMFDQLLKRSRQVNGDFTRPEDAWRFEALRNQADMPQTLSSKFSNMFGQASNPATRKWVKGELSNFHYLMIVNTMAGRTFNDLTQYPVFPWVIADYTSEELDLSDPKTYRDLTKPMGCQTPEKEAGFKERYQSFAEMGDHNSPPFHYGTHYSSAMIVTSYLIRLQPFVQSYLLLQGGSFDHADRMFYSVAKAWESAAHQNMTDVRELIPEFFYLPEFLNNMNGYDFGTRQNSDIAVNAVDLPPWAKGDPKIFVAKQREALESPYVSSHLHHWIDLIFGYKQRGEAAVEAVNVFHHLSYHGAKNLDDIDDPMERLATIGIIHNFGQTPHQIFQKPHPPREEAGHKFRRIDSCAEDLTKLPGARLKTNERVASLIFSWKHERLLCAAAFRLDIAPHHDKYLEWGFSDGSVRFYTTDSSRRLLGHFEHLHIGQLTTGVFADSRTLITAGTDCTIGIWSFVSSTKAVDLQPKSTLFGHRTPVSVIAVSRSFSAILSASTDGQIYLWDLNRLEFVRDLPRSTVPVTCARINDVTGEIVVCRGATISLYTLNGELVLQHDVIDGHSSPDEIISCAFYEGASNEWLERDVLFTGHKKGLVNVWTKSNQDGTWKLEHIRRLEHAEQRDDGTGVVTIGGGHAAITCILPMPQVVYTGDESGRVYQWDCIQRY